MSLFVVISRATATDKRFIGVIKKRTISVCPRYMCGRMINVTFYIVIAE